MNIFLFNYQPQQGAEEQKKQKVIVEEMTKLGKELDKEN